MRVAVIDYGTGNLGSMLRALEELGAQPTLASHPDQIADAARLILPGVGSFTDCMAALSAGGWPQALRAAVDEAGTPLLGVCVGMQLLAMRGSEGATAGRATAGLGFVPGTVRHLRDLGCGLRLPHVGWNAIDPAGGPDPLLTGIPAGTNFYFVHSFALETQTQDAEAPDTETPDTETPDHVIATATHDIPFVAAVRCGRVWGTQFHPEKSSRAGFRLLRNFLGDLPC
ncbi:glutamine amidotransferase [Roseicitreum antarcticum]|uniref:Imidazole glycerol phosphate synthase subunit HisH n=2 Tax=Roseicitreum antarcticum TaxID=564137 RepID=A0A1H3CIG3_9RHOB|nr:glutamine amidotransferase [Roseicitreum antarcticum]